MSTPRIPGRRRTTLNVPNTCDALIRARARAMSAELGGAFVAYTAALASLVTQGARALGMPGDQGTTTSKQ